MSDPLPIDNIDDFDISFERGVIWLGIPYYGDIAYARVDAATARQLIDKLMRTIDESEGKVSNDHNPST